MDIQHEYQTRIDALSPKERIERAVAEILDAMEKDPMVYPMVAGKEIHLADRSGNYLVNHLDSTMVHWWGHSKAHH